MSKGQRFLTAAREAFAGGHWEAAVSSSYYAAYHLVAAVLEVKSAVAPQRPWRANILLKDFRERFTNRGYLFGPKESETFDRLRNERYASDYENVLFTERRTKRVLDDAERLCAKLLEALSDG